MSRRSPYTSSLWIGTPRPGDNDIAHALPDQEILTQLPIDEIDLLESQPLLQVIREWLSLSLDKKKILVGSSKFFYSVFVSALFAALSARHGTNPFTTFLYSSSSFLANAPMAWMFSEEAVSEFKAVFTNDWKYRTVFCVSTLMALCTSVSGIKLAMDSVDGIGVLSSLGLLSRAAVGLYWFNTFSTRLVGTNKLINDVIQSTSYYYRMMVASDKTLYKVLADLKAHGLTADRLGARISRRRLLDQMHHGASEDQIMLTQIAMLSDQVSLFYKVMHENKMPIQNTWKNFLIDNFFMLFSVSLCLVMLAFAPFWIPITQKGLMALHIVNGNSSFMGNFLVVFSSLPNQFFYMRSAYRFAGNFSVLLKSYERYKDKIKNLTLTSLGVFCAVSMILAVSYFSGAGFAFEAEGVGKPSESGEGFAENGQPFGWLAGKVWMSWLGFYINLYLPIYPSYVSFAAGLVVNGRGMLNMFINSLNKKFEDSERDYFGYENSIALLERLLSDPVFKEKYGSYLVIQNMTYQRNELLPNSPSNGDSGSSMPSRSSGEMCISHYGALEAGGHEPNGHYQSCGSISSMFSKLTSFFSASSSTGQIEMGERTPLFVNS